MYRELPPPLALQALVSCTWKQSVARSRAVLVVPDACVDLLWNGAKLRVAGPDTRAVRERCEVGTSIVGLRFRTGAAGGLLAVPASAICDQRVDLVELWGDAARRLEDALLALGGGEALAHRALALLSDTVRQRVPCAAPSDPLVLRLVARLQEHAGSLRVAELARELGVSERMLHRRTLAAVGYGPKLLARILRLRAFRRALSKSPQQPLATLACELGYADQAHLSHDARELFATTPGRMQRDALSDFDKTQGKGARQTPAHVHS